MVSKIKRKNIPARKPMTAGTTAHLPLSAHISMLGMRRDQTDAAIITPDAKPKRDFCQVGEILLRRAKTIAAPKVVPINGIVSPTAKTESVIVS